jgi:hypothetical protein
MRPHLQWHQIQLLQRGKSTALDQSNDILESAKRKSYLPRNC